MEKRLEALLLATRWVLLPLYIALLAVIAAIYVMVGREILHLFAIILTASDTEIVLLVLAVLDLVLVGNLLVVVALTSYETSISTITAEGSKPDWLGKVNSSAIKGKVSLAIVLISSIYLLRAYINETSLDRLLLLCGVHLTFVVSALAITYAGSEKKSPDPVVPPSH